MIKANDRKRHAGCKNRKGLGLMHAAQIQLLALRIIDALQCESLSGSRDSSLHLFASESLNELALLNSKSKGYTHIILKGYIHSALLLLVICLSLRRTIVEHLSYLADCLSIGNTCMCLYASEHKPY